MQSKTFKRNGHLLEKKFKEYLIPTTLSGMSMMIACIVDGIIVGQTMGADAMAAVNVAEPIVMFLQIVFMLFAAGGATLVSVAKGERDKNKAHTAFTLSLGGMFFVSLFFIGVGIFYIDALTGVICNNETLFTYTKEYVHVLLLGAPLMVLVPGMSFLIRADGRPQLSAQMLIVANVINLGMDFVYISFFNMGIAGAALATVTGYTVGCIWILRYWFSKERTLKIISLTKQRLALLGEIFSYGSAISVTTLLLSLNILFINQIVLALGGANAMAVFTVCNFSIALISMFITGASDTMVPLLGLLYGEKDWKGTRFVFLRTMLVVIICCVASALLLELFPVAILRVFNVVEPSTVSMGIAALRIFALSLVGVGISCTFMYYLQVMKHPKIAVFISLLRGFVLLLPLAYLLSNSYGIEGVWWAYVLAETLTLLLAVAVCTWVWYTNKARYANWILEEKPAQNEKVYDVSINSGSEEAVALSQGLIAFGKEHNLSAKNATFLGLLAEEAAVNISQYNKNQQNLTIDVLCRIDEKNILLSLRDDGKALDMFSAKDDDNLVLDNITVMKKIAKKLEYSRTLGLNSTVMLLEITT